MNAGEMRRVSYTPLLLVGAVALYAIWLTLYIQGRHGGQLELDFGRHQGAHPLPAPEPEHIPETVECSSCGTTYPSHMLLCPRCGTDNPWK